MDVAEYWPKRESRIEHSTGCVGQFADSRVHWNPHTIPGAVSWHSVSARDNIRPQGSR
jgi:hypothetical protein